MKILVVDAVEKTLLAAWLRALGAKDLILHIIPAHMKDEEYRANLDDLETAVRSERWDAVMVGNNKGFGIAVVQTLPEELRKKALVVYSASTRLNEDLRLEYVSLGVPEANFASRDEQCQRLMALTKPVAA